MHYCLLDMLACPIDNGYPLEPSIISRTQTLSELRKPQERQCREYCAIEKRMVDSKNHTLPDEITQCCKCNEIEIELGFLRCPRCNRWYPIQDGIVTLLPDTLRQETDKHFFGLVKPYAEKHKIIAEITPGFVLTDIGGNLQKNEFDRERDIEDKKREMQVRNNEAKVYDTYRNEYEYFAEILPVLNHLQVKKTDRVLDIGIGTGQFVPQLLPRINELVALDFSLASLKECRLKINPYAKQKLTSFIQADIEHLPFVTHPIFDKVMSTGVFSLLPSTVARKKAYHDITKFLKPDGFFVFTVFNYNIFYKRDHKPQQWYGETGIYIYQFTEAELKNELTSFFRTVKLTGILNIQHIGTRIGKKMGKSARLIDRWIEKTPLAKHISSLWLAKCTL